jgi:hypothetical protein
VRSCRVPARLTFDAIAKIGLTLPGAELGTAYGTPALTAGGKMFAVMAINKSAEPNTLCVRMDFESRDELIAADPDTYYTAEHYLPYPCVLVRLHRVKRDALRDLLSMGSTFVLSKTPKKRKKKSATQARKQER